MRFDIITIFPESFNSYLNESILKRAQKKGLIQIKIHDLRNFTKDPHKKVDDRPYGGGPGMVIKIEPLTRVISLILKSKTLPRYQAGKIQKRKTQVVLFSTLGKQFDQKIARDFAKKRDRIIMIAGHYEGVDERIKSVVRDFGFKIQELSIGPYVLTGGELAGMVLVDAVSRHIPGVLGKEESLEEKRYGAGVPVYTRPEIFLWKNKKYKTPKVLLSGDHQKIEQWRKGHIKA
ncbi:MAG: tRNA (guanosine(37)-N1)-methyltransferase TrmD [Parcubacteria group bacterium]|nr:tRNA (guanosine(37)-N1)-methyltransferase TrmD [Parcubacteria group bacterium]